MAANIRDQIKHLNQTINDLQSYINKISKNIDNLNNKNSVEIKTRDQELKDLRGKLTACSQERDAIQRTMDDKVKELENSNLSSLEKHKQINQILTNNKTELNSVNQTLMES